MTKEELKEELKQIEPSNVLYFAKKLRDVTSKGVFCWGLLKNCKTILKRPDCDIKNIVDDAEGILSKIATVKQSRDIISLTEAMRLAVKKNRRGL